MQNARPAALMGENVADRIRIGNFEEHFERVGEADWIVEAIIEKLEAREIMQRVEDTAKKMQSSRPIPLAYHCTASPRAGPRSSKSVS